MASKLSYTFSTNQVEYAQREWCVMAMDEDLRHRFDDFYRDLFPAARRHAARLFGSADAEDIAQDAMLRALTHFRDLRTDRSAWPWLTVVVRNVGIDRRRQDRVVPVKPSILDSWAGSAPDSGAQAHARVEVADLLRRAASRLSANDRRVLALHEVCGFGLAEIAASTGTTTNAIRQRLFRARRKLSRHCSVRP